MMSLRGLQHIVGAIGRSPHAVVYCGGPCPELLGLAVALAQSGPAVLKLTSIDANAASWAWAVDIGESLVGNLAPVVRVERSAIAGDLSGKLDEAVIAGHNTADIVIFQNCLNEVWAAAQAQANIATLASTVRSGASLAIVDQANYGITAEAFASLRRLVSNEQWEVLEEPIPWSMRTDFFLPPAVRSSFFDEGPPVRENGFWLGQYPRRNVTAISLIARRR